MRDIGTSPAESSSRNVLEKPWDLSEEEFLRRAKSGAVIFSDDFNLGVLGREFQTEIILSEIDFADKNLFRLLGRETEVEFLPKETPLLMNVSTKKRIGHNLEEQI